MASGTPVVALKRGSRGRPAGVRAGPTAGSSSDPLDVDAARCNSLATGRGGSLPRGRITGRGAGARRAAAGTRRGGRWDGSGPEQRAILSRRGGRSREGPDLNEKEVRGFGRIEARLGERKAQSALLSQASFGGPSPGRGLPWLQPVGRGPVTKRQLLICAWGPASYPLSTRRDLNTKGHIFASRFFREGEGATLGRDSSADTPTIPPVLFPARASKGESFGGRRGDLDRGGPWAHAGRRAAEAVPGSCTISSPRRRPDGTILDWPVPRRGSRPPRAKSWEKVSGANVESSCSNGVEKLFRGSGNLQYDV